MSSKTIYPYVYRLDKLETNEFYIGYRAANIVPSEQDLGFEYFTSAPKIKEKFNQFQITIIAEFFDADDAYDHEQYLIYCDLGNPLMLNKSCYYESKARFNNTGNIHTKESREKISIALKGKKRASHTEETKKKMSESAKLRGPRSAETRAKMSESQKNKPPVSDETKAKLSAAGKGRKLSEHQKITLRNANIGRKHSDETKKKISDAATGRVKSEETRAKLSAAHTGKPSPCKGKISSEETKKKISDSLKLLPKVSCPHCGKEGAFNMTRYHFDNCKLSPNDIYAVINP